MTKPDRSPSDQNPQDQNPQDQPPHLTVIGGGFAGLWFARAFTRVLAGAPLRITLIDRANHHLFRPLVPHRVRPTASG